MGENEKCYGKPFKRVAATNFNMGRLSKDDADSPTHRLACFSDLCSRRLGQLFCVCALKINQAGHVLDLESLELEQRGSYHCTPVLNLGGNMTPHVDLDIDVHAHYGGWQQNKTKQ